MLTDAGAAAAAAARSGVLERFARVIRDVGFPVVVALLLLWHLVVQVPRELQATRDELGGIRRVLEVLLEVHRYR